MYPRYMQYVATITAAWLSTCSHMITGWNSPGIAKLTSEDSPIGTKLSEEEASWVASIPMLGFIIGSMTSAYIIHTFGSKKTLTMASIPIVTSWIVIAFTKSLTTLIVMRFLAGVGDSFIVTALPLYMGEVADKDIRGGLTTAIAVMNSLGNVFLYSAGPFLPYKMLAILCAIIPVLVTAVFIYMPDSPYFLCKKENENECKKNLRTLMGNYVDDLDIHNRFLEVQSTVTFNTETASLRNVYKKRNYRRAIIVVIGLKVFTHLSGMSALKSFLQTVIQVSRSSISPEVSSIIFGFVQIPSVLLAAFLMDRAGRKLLYILSAIGSSVCLICEGLYFYHEDSSFIKQIAWFPTMCLTVYLIFVPLGITSVPFVITGEVLASDIKSSTSAFSTTIAAVVSFLSTRYFLPISVAYGMYVMFFIYAICCILASIFVYYSLPETKGKSFLEIQELLLTRSCC